MKIGNGSIPLRIGNLIDTTVYGGPYIAKPGHMFGVKMAVEVDARHHVAVDTPDFGVPKVSDLQVGVVRALMSMINRQPVYAGCMGGIGRTGLFLAALAKVQIEYRKVKHRPGRGEDPVLYVRRYYMSHAIETEQQKKYIADFDVSGIVNWLDVTQTALGLGGLTPAKEQPVTHANVCAPPPYVKPSWIADEDKIDNPAFDNFKQDWKLRGGNIEALVERDLDWMDEIDADSASEVVDLDDDIRFDDLYTQIGDLEDRVTRMQYATQKAFGSADDNFNNLMEALTKPNWFSKIRGILKK